MPYDFSHLSILAVDDNDFMRKLYREILNAIGVKNDRIQDATEGSHAIEVIKRFSPDLIICDLQMKPMDGVTFLRHVRTHEKSPASCVPIIVATGHSDLKHIVSARDAGANEILRKPISAGSIYERIRAIIENPRQFIKTESFTGPDRRRRNLPFEGPDRREADIDVC